MSIDYNIFCNNFFDLKYNRRYGIIYKTGGETLKGKNIWKNIVCDELLEMMKLLGCEKKYIDGTASDFECFREWISLCSYAKDSSALITTADKISELFQTNVGEEYLYSCCAKELWRAFEGGAELPKCTVEKSYESITASCLNFSVEKEYLTSREEHFFDCCDFDEASFDEYVKKAKNTDGTRFFIIAPKDEFERPDRYHASEYYDKYIRGEKCNNTVIILQTAFELIYEKKCVIIHIKVDDDMSAKWAEELLRYFSLRGFSEKIFIWAGKNATPETIKSICKNYENAVPVLFEKSEGYIREFSKIYPIGATLVI